MKVYRKESRQIYMSVEGKNCEVIYFEHLARLINNSGRNTYNLKIMEINNIECGNKQETYQGFSFYRDNPATSVHEVVKIIFEICGIRRENEVDLTNQ